MDGIVGVYLFFGIVCLICCIANSAKNKMEDE